MGSGGSKVEQSEKVSPKEAEVQGKENENAVKDCGNREKATSEKREVEAKQSCGDATAAAVKLKNSGAEDGKSEGPQNGTRNGTSSKEIHRNGDVAAKKEDSSAGEETSEDVPGSLPSDGRVDMRGRNSRKVAGTSKRISFYDMVDAAEILPYLFIGNMASAKSEEFLKRKNVAFILDLTPTAARGEQGQKEGEEWEVEGRKRKRVGMEDDDEVVISSHFQSCFAFIEKAKAATDKKHTRAVLVHSYFGLSRTSAVVLAYLMKEKHWSLREAFAHLKQRQASAKPNDGFAVQLLRYEQEERGKMSMTLKDFYQQY